VILNWLFDITPNNNFISSGTKKNRIYDNGERERNRRGLDKKMQGTKQGKMLNEQLQLH